MTVLRGDCRWYMQRFGRQVDAIVTDPPYELGFMSKPWDQRGISFDPRTWKLAYHVLKPGGRLLAFGAPRTSHRIWCAIEDAGFVIEDTVMWLFGSGYPKHKSKLKPFYEPICVARKGPVSVLNIDAGRIPHDEECRVLPPQQPRDRFFGQDDRREAMLELKPAGRWPPNVAMDEEAAALLDQMTGTLTSGSMKAGQQRKATRGGGGYMGGFPDTATHHDTPGDSGGASRFLYVAKASRREREQGLEGHAQKVVHRYNSEMGQGPTPQQTPRRPVAQANHHPTVKPVALMRWLVKMVTEPGDLVLDPFTGSGTTGMACALEGREFVGIEQDAEHADIADRRIANALGPLFADGASGSGSMILLQRVQP